MPSHRENLATTYQTAHSDLNEGAAIQNLYSNIFKPGARKEYLCIPESFQEEDILETKREYNRPREQQMVIKGYNTGEVAPLFQKAKALSKLSKVQPNKGPQTFLAPPCRPKPQFLNRPVDT